MGGMERIVLTYVGYVFLQHAASTVNVSGSVKMASGGRDAMLAAATTVLSHTVIRKEDVSPAKGEHGVVHAITCVHRVVKTIYVKRKLEHVIVAARPICGGLSVIRCVRRNVHTIHVNSSMVIAMTGVSRVTGENCAT